MKHLVRTLLLGLSLMGTTQAAAPSSAKDYAEAGKPNVVFIFADDMGYGEVQALNPEWGKIPTPHLDKLVSAGMTFTDAHTTSSVCTPSRYGLLTGRYNWRTTLQSFVLGDGDDPLIAADRMTLGHLFREQGYYTAIIGKWHLGFTNVVPDELKGVARPKKTAARYVGPVPTGSQVPDGPITRGFDEFFGWHHARSMSSLIRGDTYIEEIDIVEVLPRQNREVSRYIDEKAADARAGKPFFLYVPISSPHSPIVPAPEWKGKGGLGDDYSDFIVQTDGFVGDVAAALERNGLTDNTILIFSADNGSSGNRSSSEKLGHRSHGHLSGAKASLLEGGHRVPFILRWPAKVEAGTVSNQLICLSDIMETFAEMFSVDLPDTAAEDSISFLPALYSQPVPEPVSRVDVVHHDKDGRFAIRQGDWKLLLLAPKGNKGENARMQLYNLKDDIGEKKNLIGDYPEKSEAMLELLQSYIENGRSTPGSMQENDADIDLWKLKTQKREKTSKKTK
ncbi:MULTISPECIES: arylsulfatase [unclassified Lentimonas]|uniref:sulfatase family protein n=2 Tax=Lentimonas TaxID=417293 RepID=UPI001FD2F300|nr:MULTISPECIES: arylsulfatase [unclassified Lentimonas]